MFASAEVVGQFGVWEWRPKDGQLLWSDNLYRIYGYEPGEVTPSPEVVYALVHPDDLYTYASDVLTHFHVIPPVAVLPGSSEEVEQILRACHELRIVGIRFHGDDRKVQR